MKVLTIRINLFIWFLTGCSFLLAQNSKIDSLKNLLNSPHTGAEKFKLYGEISWAYINNSQLQQARNYADTLRLSAELSKDTNGIVQAKFYYGVIARLEGKHTEALDYLQDFAAFNTGIGDSVKVSKGLYQIGYINARIGNYEKSLAVLYRALLIQEAEDPISAIHTLNAIGSVLKSTKRFPDALKTYNRALEIDSINSDVLMNIGNVYWEMDELNQARIYYDKALKIDREKNNDWAVAYDLENIGNLFNKMSAPDSALVYHMRALSIRKTLPNPVEEAISLSQVGITYVKLGDYVPADKFLSKALILAKETNTSYLIRDIYDKLAILNEHQKKFNQAYRYLRSYIQVKDSLLNEKSSAQIGDLKIKYETEKKDQQITLLATEKELQQKEAQRQSTLKNASVTGIILIALLAGLLLFTFRQRLKNQKTLASKNEEINQINYKRKLTELEMKALQAQINPHFIFNCLNSINEMILSGDNAKGFQIPDKVQQIDSAYAGKCGDHGSIAEK